MTTQKLAIKKRQVLARNLKNEIHSRANTINMTSKIGRFWAEMIFSMLDLLPCKRKRTNDAKKPERSERQLVIR